MDGGETTSPRSMQHAQAGNAKNSGIQRIMKEWKVMQKDEGKYGFDAHPSEDDIFEWHFTIHGPPDSEFEGGIYHGRINLPPEYPFKPPAIMLLTDNGRFETNKKICLSISNYHPEHWQPSWDIRTIITALVAFFTTEGQGAIGALDCPPDERKKLAAKSHTFVCPKCGDAAADFCVRVPVPTTPGKLPGGEPASPASTASSPPSSVPPSPAVPAQQTPQSEAASAAASQNVPASPPPASPEAAPAPAAASPPIQPVRSPVVSPRGAAQEQKASSSRFGGLEMFAVALLVLIMGIVARKMLR